MRDAAAPRSWRRVGRLIIVAVWVLTIPWQASAQADRDLYLVSGYPWDEPYRTDLYRVNKDGKTIIHVVELLPGSVGTDSIRSYTDQRLLIAASPPIQPNRFVVLKTDAAPCRPISVEAQFDTLLPKPPPQRITKYIGYSVLASHLLDIPGKGLYVALELHSDELSQIWGVNLLTSEQETLDPGMLRFALPPGVSGVGHDDRFYVDLQVDALGVLNFVWPQEGALRWIDMGWPRSVDFDPGDDVMWLVRTAELDLVKKRQVSRVFHLFDRSRREWRRVLLPGEEFNFKPFGRWLAGPVVGKAHGEFTKELSGRMHAEKRERDVRYARLLERNPKGELFLYDTSTDKDYTIRTGDIESEVLLIENDLVYYRIKDRLYRSAIRQGRVEEPELLAQDPALTNVYWAFSGPTCEPVRGQDKK